MLRAKRPLVKLPYSCALMLSNHTDETDQRNQMNELPATRGETVAEPYSSPRSSFCTAATVRLCVEEGTAAG
jgi:hypothetical protein